MPLFFDTETTGFANDKVELTDPAQPYILQIAAILDDEAGNTKASLSLMINAGCGEVPKGAFDVHGISRKTYETFGVSPLTALGAFHGLVDRCDVMIAHNYAYDIKLLKIAYARLDRLAKFTTEVQSKPNFCTMQASTDIVKIPASYGRGGYKWPKLDEAYRVLVDSEGFSGAHDAMADTSACREVYYKLRKETA